MIGLNLRHWIGVRRRPLAVLTLLVCGLQIGCATLPPAQPENICSVFDEKRHWHKAAVKAQDKWGTSMHTVMAIMYQESAYVDDARPPRTKLLGFIPWKRPSSAYGYPQAVNGTWDTYQRSRGEPWRSRDNFVDATDFIHWYLGQSHRRLGLSTHDVYSLYLSYHEGWAGFERKTYESKAWLKRTAGRVQRRARQYAIQYGGCQERLNRQSWWDRWF